MGSAAAENSNIVVAAAKANTLKSRNGAIFPASFVRRVAVILICGAWVHPTAAREKDATQYGAGLIVNVPFPESEVVQVVQDVVQNGIIRGTKEYSKDEYISGAESVNSTRAFEPWAEGGTVFYKVRFKALDPWNFKDTNDSGTVAVRYVVQVQDDKHTVLRIDAKFVEDFRHVSHPSNGSVEGSEYKDIHDRLEAMALMKTQATEAQKAKEYSSSSAPAVALKDQSATPSEPPQENPTAGLLPPLNPRADAPATVAPLQNLEERVHELRKQVERTVKAPGAPLKSAPFHTASTVQSLASGAEVLIVISTPYWFGVETHEGQHGWILRDELEPLP